MLLLRRRVGLGKELDILHDLLHCRHAAENHLHIGQRL